MQAGLQKIWALEGAHNQVLCTPPPLCLCQTCMLGGPVVPGAIDLRSPDSVKSLPTSHCPPPPRGGGRLRPQNVLTVFLPSPQGGREAQ